MTEVSKDTFFYNFLTNSKFRVYKHILLVLSMSIISFNQVVMAYQDCMDILGNRIYWLCLSMFVVYLVLAYLNIYLLVPKLLLKGKYGIYIIALVALVAILPLFSLFLQEYLVRTILSLAYRVDSYSNPLILVSSLSLLLIMMICFSGTSVSIFFRNWIIESKLVSELEKEQIQSAVDQLKDQITPNFLSNILNRTSVLVKTEPERASDMLMRLGQLLRYQLYDCSREKVLLSSEINFLRNFLDLEQLYSSRLDYNILITGDVNRLLVSPLLFIPFVQYAVDTINNKDQQNRISIHFENDHKNIIFTCESDDKELFVEERFQPIRQRLNLLCRNNHSLSISNGLVILQLNLVNS